jgi:hypothetical protein
MKKIKGFLINHGYSAHRVWVTALGVIVFNNLDGRVFDIPAFVLWFLIMLMYAAFVHAVVYPLTLHFLPTLIMYIRNGFKLPTKDNYANKSEYILPFTGKWTVGNGGFRNGEWHSGGRLGSERNAYDFNIMEDEDGSTPDDWALPETVEEYPCYGREVTAVADGIVMKVRNHHPNSRTKNLKAYCDTYDYKGNHIIIKHNENEYSLTVHLMPNSITVKKGDKVKQGQVIARCGNSGNCSAPHIHFALQSGVNRFFSYALPIGFTNIKAEDSPAHRAFCEALGRKPAKFGENIAIEGDKTYIGRGVDVENIFLVESTFH